MAAGTNGGGVRGTESYVPPAGYELGAVIGRGGMGEVLAATCQRIGREVAIKRMRTTHPTSEQISRFLREARVQARLDHPAIVPVHELGYDSDGRPYFTMKRLAGLTMMELLTRGTDTTPRLLRGFVDVCLAISLAHKRNVVHRDMKPSNIMLGDFGEVYVLDWGVARVLADTDAGDSGLNHIDTLSDGTQAGDMPRTPGYMSPEQMRGEGDQRVDRRLRAGRDPVRDPDARETLHPRGHAAVSATLAIGAGGPDGPATRKKDGSVPPELDALCLAALATDPAARPTARELADRRSAATCSIGDRDVARRRGLAAEQVTSALEVLDSNAPDARATAMRRAGRALALDPEAREAAALVASLMLEPPAELTPDLEASLDYGEANLAAKRGKQGVYALLRVVLVVRVDAGPDLGQELAAARRVLRGHRRARRHVERSRDKRRSPFVVVTAIGAHRC